MSGQKPKHALRLLRLKSSLTSSPPLTSVVPSPLVFNLALVIPSHSSSTSSLSLLRPRQHEEVGCQCPQRRRYPGVVARSRLWSSLDIHHSKSHTKLNSFLGPSSMELGRGGTDARALAKGDGGAVAPPPPAVHQSGPQDGKGGGGGSTPSGSGGGARTPSTPSGRGSPGMDSAPPPPPNTQKVIFFCCLTGDHPVPVPTLPPAATRP